MEPQSATVRRLRLHVQIVHGSPILFRGRLIGRMLGFDPSDGGLNPSPEANLRDEGRGMNKTLQFFFPDVAQLERGISFKN